MEKIQRQRLYGAYCDFVKVRRTVIMDLLRLRATGGQLDRSTHGDQPMAQLKKRHPVKGLAILGILIMLIASHISSVRADILLPELQVQGNTKSQLSFIKHLVQDCLKELKVEEWSDLHSVELQQCVFDSKLFSKVDMVIAEPVIRISVIERWTIIPIPFVQAGQNSSSVGLLIMDTHFLGRGKQAAIGGATGDRGDSLFISYRDPAINFSNWTASAHYNNRQTDYIRYEKDMEVDGYAETGYSVGLAFGYKFMPSLEAGAQLQLHDYEYQVLDPYALVPGNYRHNKLGVAIDYDHTDFHFYFQEGYKLRAQVWTQISRNDDENNVADLEVNYDWQLAVFHKHALQLKLESRYVDSADIRDAYKLGGNLGYRGVEPASVWARVSHSVSVDYKVPVLNNGWGVWTVGPFVDHAVFKEFDMSGMTNSTAYGGSVYMFLKGIAIPGIGIMVGRNNDYLGNFASLTIGFALN